MTGTDTQTAAAMTDVINWTRATYKGHGQPTRFYYWGTGKVGDAEDGLLVTSVKVDGTKITLDGGREVRTLDVRTRFWVSPAPEPVRVPQPRQTEDAKAIQAAAKATRPSRNAKLSDCRCGCSAQVKGLYKQGHDARHAGDVARRAIAQLISDPDLNLADLSDLVSELPTDALQAKALKMITSRVK